MASLTQNNGTGATIAFATSAWAALIKDIKIKGIKRKALETTHMGTAAPAAGKWGNATFMPGDISEGGELEIECFYNPDTVIPVDAVAETITISLPGSTTPATLAFTGFIIAADIGVPLEDMMMVTLTVKISGNVTRTAGT